MILTELLRLKESKSPGPDEIPAKILKELAGELSKPLSMLFHTSFETGYLPPDWKSAWITPLYKGGSRVSANNYRPVSLTSICCKIMEKIIKQQLMQFLEQNHLLSDSQHGFRKGRSCVTNLLYCLEHWTRAVDRGDMVHAIYIDFKKAFDSVPHHRLLYKLSRAGVRAVSNDGFGKEPESRVNMILASAIGCFGKQEEKEKMEKCIKKAWMNVTLWKHRYEQSCKKYAVLEEQFNQSERMRAQQEKDLNRSKKMYEAAVRVAVRQNSEIERLKSTMDDRLSCLQSLLKRQMNSVRQSANSRVLRCLEEQSNSDLEKAALVIRLNRVDEELRRLKLERVSNTAAVNPTSGDSMDLTYLRTELKRLEREAIEAEASERVKLLGQEISLRDLEISSYKDKLAQLQRNFARQDQILSARLEELESYKSRELELRRYFAQQIQSLEMSLSAAHHAFAVREKQLLQQLHSAKM
nr:unnamed protein product [Spirometra erinaceieuropaei]